MSKCPCKWKQYDAMHRMEPNKRPRSESEICVDCRFSWGVKDE